LTGGTQCPKLKGVFLVATLINLYSFVVLVSVIGSWIGSENEVFKLADRMVDPVLRPIRERIPPAGGIDLSPMLLLVALRLLGSLFH
jgi:YggT family protein